MFQVLQSPPGGWPLHETEQTWNIYFHPPRMGYPAEWALGKEGIHTGHKIEMCPDTGQSLDTEQQAKSWFLRPSQKVAVLPPHERFSPQVRLGSPAPAPPGEPSRLQASAWPVRGTCRGSLTYRPWVLNCGPPGSASSFPLSAPAGWAPLAGARARG